MGEKKETVEFRLMPPIKCPGCGSQDITNYGNPRFKEPNVFVNVHCVQCGLAWCEVYTYVAMFEHDCEGSDR